MSEETKEQALPDAPPVEAPPARKRAAHMLPLPEYPEGSPRRSIEEAVDEKLTRAYRELAREFPHVKRKDGHEVWLYVLAAHLANGAYQCCRQPAHLQAVMTQTNRYWLRLQLHHEGAYVRAPEKPQ